MQKGFTIIELMLTMLVLVIVLSIGIPSFSTWIKDSRMDTGTREVASALKLARSEAASRQTIINVRAGTSGNPGNWANGVHIYTDVDVTGNTPYVAADTLIKDIDSVKDNITIASDDPNNIISFNSSGLLNEGGFGIQRTIRICQSTGEAAGNTVVVNSTGRTSITSITNCP